jgi:hypothetical protein
MNTPAPDYRALCAELLFAYKGSIDRSYEAQAKLIAKVEAALDATPPAPADGPSDADLWSLCMATGGDYAATTPGWPITFARAILARYAPPRAEPVAVSDVRYEFSVYDEEGEEQAGGSSQYYKDVLLEGEHYLMMYGAHHRLEIRRVEALPLPEGVG